MAAEPQTDLGPIHQAAWVPQAPPEAFRLFTAELAAWWPLATHSVGLADASTVVLEPCVGGGIVESFAGECTARWGTVEAWDPPRLVRFTWHPGREEAAATEVTVTFTAEGGGTRVDLEHAGWQRRPDGVEARDRYVPGWTFVLGCYVELAGGSLGHPASDGSALAG